MSKPRSGVAAVLFILLGTPLEAIAQQAQQPSAPPPDAYYWPGPWHHMWMWGDGYAWSFWWMLPMMTFFIVVAGAILFVAWRASGQVGHHLGPARPMDPTYSALEILNERFARGEIQNDEYAAKKSAILSGARQ